LKNKKTEKKHNHEFITVDNEFKEAGAKQIHNKYEYDLYHEEYDKVYQVFQVKFVKNELSWKAYRNSKLQFVVYEKELLPHHISYLKNKNGFDFLLSCAKMRMTTSAQVFEKLNELLPTPKEQKNAKTTETASPIISRRKRNKDKQPNP
jgi:hypothetical protein